MIISKYDLINKYKIYVIGQDIYRHRDHQRVIIKLRSKYKSNEGFVTSIINSKNKMSHDSHEASSREFYHNNSTMHQNHLVLKGESLNSSSVPQFSGSNNPKFDGVYIKSRNIHNNLQSTKTDTNPYQNYMSTNRIFNTTTEKGDRQRSVGSTIYRDIDIHDSGQKEERRHNAISIKYPNRNRYQSELIKGSISESYHNEDNSNPVAEEGKSEPQDKIVELSAEGIELKENSPIVIREEAKEPVIKESPKLQMKIVNEIQFENTRKSNGGLK